VSPLRRRRWALLAAVVAALLVFAACSSDPSGDGASPPVSVADDGQDHEHDEEESGIDHHGNLIQPDPFYEKIEVDGVAVEFTLGSFLGVGGRGGDISTEVVAQSHSAITFNISDAATGDPIAGARPLAWLNAASDRSCRDSVAAYTSGAVSERPLIDFNTFFVLALNNDPSISVIDPNIDVGGMTNLYAAIPLASAGAAWAMAPDEATLMVTLPASEAVALVDLESFQVANTTIVTGSPTGVVAGPGATFWVTTEPAGGDGEVVVLDSSGVIQGRVATGPGSHAVAFSTDGHSALVANSASGDVVVIDVATLEIAGRLDVRGTPTGVVVAPDDDLYITTLEGSIVRIAADGTATAFQGVSRMVSITAGRSGRWAMAPSPAEGAVVVVDLQADAVAHVVPIDGLPDEVAFGAETAYVRLAGAPEIAAIELDSLVRRAPAVVRITTARTPAGTYPNQAIGQTLGASAAVGAVVVANPADDEITFLPEGSPVASGGYQGHGLEPRAALLVDRSLVEVEDGVFSGKLRLPSAGTFEVAFALDDPAIVHCFTFEASGEDPDAATVELEVAGPVQASVGTETVLRVRLTDGDGAPIDGVPDFQALAKHTASPASETSVGSGQGDGWYGFTFVLANAGAHQVFFSSSTLETPYRSLPTTYVIVEP